MSSQQEGLGTALRRLYRGIVSLITTGSWHVEEAAEAARSAGMVLDQIDEAVEQDAQRTLDHVDDALTSWNMLGARADRLRKSATGWEDKARRVAQEAAKYAEGTAERTKWEALTKQALTGAMKARDLLVPLEQAIEEARPQAEEALKLVEQVGMSKETALSERDRLEITRATAEAKKNLAMAMRSGAASKGQQLLAEATAKVDRLVAQVAADEAIAERLPAEPTQVEAEISALSRQDRVNDAFTKLIAEVSPSQPSEASTA